MLTYEHDYAQLVKKILAEGDYRQTRNSGTKAIFGQTLTVDTRGSNLFPILHGRKMWPNGVLGELAAMLKGPKSLADFEKHGCNYWKDWADENGDIRVDYGNSWLDFNGYNQLDALRDSLLHNRTNRRMLISGWRPDKLKDLSLPCCHLLYQWFVREDEYLDMIWYQRSVDVMVGLPSDVIFAHVWNMMIANNVGLTPGRITFVLGDTHIYQEHFDAAEVYLERADKYCNRTDTHVTADLLCHAGKKFEDFVPTDIQLSEYDPYPAIKLELLA